MIKSQLSAVAPCLVSYQLSHASGKKCSLVLKGIGNQIFLYIWAETIRIKLCNHNSCDNTGKKNKIKRHRSTRLITCYSPMAWNNQYTTKHHCLSTISFQYFPFKCQGKLSSLIFLSEPSKMHFSSLTGNFSWSLPCLFGETKAILTHIKAVLCNGPLQENSGRKIKKPQL